MRHASTAGEGASAPAAAGGAGVQGRPWAWVWAWAPTRQCLRLHSKQARPPGLKAQLEKQWLSAQSKYFPLRRAPAAAAGRGRA